MHRRVSIPDLEKQDVEAPGGVQLTDFGWEARAERASSAIAANLLEPTRAGF
jgi:hypothetical protein